MKTIEQNTTELEMKEAYDRRVAQLVANPDQYIKSGVRRFGLEIEYGVIQTGAETCNQDQRDNLLDVDPESWKPELGASQIELNTRVHLLTSQGISDLYQELTEQESLMTQASKRAGLAILRSGTNPWLPISGIKKTAGEKYEKYQIVPDYYNQNRNLVNTRLGLIESIDVSDLAIVSLLNALQINLEAQNMQDALDLFNRSLALSPIMTALNANARFLENKDTGIADIRNIAWSMAVDDRTPYERQIGRATRVGLPSNYFLTIKDYLNDAGSYPFILNNTDAALEIGIGMYWRDARIKTIGDSLVVEFSP